MRRLMERIDGTVRERLGRTRARVWKRVRELARPHRERVAPIAVALALLVPAAGGLLVVGGERADTDDGRAAVESTEERAVRAGRTSSDGPGGAGGEAASAGIADEEARTGDGESPDVGRAWAEAALEREREATAEALAGRFGIGVGLAREIHTAAVEEEVEPEVAFGLVRTESSFRRTVVSWAGAVGYTQLLPSTARWIAPGTNRSDLFETRTNLRVGFRYLRYLIDKYGGDTRLALLAYNRGPGTVDGILRRGGNPANGYAAKVLGE
ncbi:MAG: transglycosylase SLT domain-containing protein [Gemmatimonadota bacterium]